MGLWENIRRLSNAATIQGVQDPGRVDVLTPAQAVQVIDDVSHAVPPVLVPLAETHITIAGVALEFSAAILSPGPSGSLIVNARGSNGVTAGANIEVFTVPRPLGTTALATVAGTALTAQTNGLAPLHTWRTGNLAASLLVGTFVPTRVGVGGRAMDMFLAPGREWVIQLVGVAAGLFCTVEVQDVPISTFTGQL